MNSKHSLIDRASGGAYDFVFGSTNEENTQYINDGSGESKSPINGLVIQATNTITNINIPELNPNYTLVYENLKTHWQTYLKPKGVKLPRFKGKLGFSLTILAAHMGSFIHIDDIKKTLQENNFKLTGTDPVQVRHLSTQSGWWIEKEGKYKHKLCSTQEPLPGFIAQKRASKLDTNSWNALKHEYQNKCVNCGSKENEPLRWDQTKITALQQGHMDPRKDLTTNNCIPQCGFCNQAYKNKAIFNKRGIVVDFLKSGF